MRDGQEARFDYKSIIWDYEGRSRSQVWLSMEAFFEVEATIPDLQILFLKPLEC